MKTPKTLAQLINRLPKWPRDYIMNIETEADPAGTIRRIAEQDELIRQLTAQIAELKEPGFLVRLAIARRTPTFTIGIAER